jgi:hypothetical protein
MENVKLDQINTNLTGFFVALFEYIERLWKFIKKFFPVTEAGPTHPLYTETNAAADEGEE